MAKLRMQVLWLSIKHGELTTHVPTSLMVVSKWSTYQWFQIQLELLDHGRMALWFRVKTTHDWKHYLGAILLPVPRKPSRIVENIDSKSSLLGFCAVLPISVCEVSLMWTTLPLFSYPSITWCFFVPWCCTGINNSLPSTTTSTKTDVGFVFRWLARNPHVFPNLLLSKLPNPTGPTNSLQPKTSILCKHTLDARKLFVKG